MGGISRGTPSTPEGELTVSGQMRLWNTETLAWEAATKGTGVGQAVDVQNFPAVLSGSQIPISDANADPTFKYKITDIDSTAGNQYFGYVESAGGWYIMNLTAATARYARGDANYTTNWGNRAILQYGYFDVVF
jgi:hypothetical protein